MKLDLPGNRQLSLTRPVIIGVLNVTPDSFSDGGVFTDIDAAVTHAERMAADGADVIDVGAESTRPGSQRVPADEQRRRIMPVIEELTDRLDVPISIDTTRAAVAAGALDLGAAIINDVSAGRDDEGMLPLAAKRSVPIVLMHMLSSPADMQDDPQYDDVVAEVSRFLLDRARRGVDAGVRPQQIVIDPGIGFGKTTEHNLMLIANLHELVATGYVVMLGTSRKRFIGQVTGAAEPTDRVAGTVATTALGVMAGVQMFRVHDVAANRQAADVTFAIRQHQTEARRDTRRGHFSDHDKP